MWLVPPAVVTVLAMTWAAWAGRPQREGAERTDGSYEKFARAIAKEHPGAGRPRPSVVRDRSTGIAVRPSRGGDSTRPTSSTRRSA
jgi:hypothetical protein